jgi:hypothetical protein
MTNIGSMATEAGRGPNDGVAAADSLSQPASVTPSAYNGDMDTNPTTTDGPAASAAQSHLGVEQNGRSSR